MNRFLMNINYFLLRKPFFTAFGINAVLFGLLLMWKNPIFLSEKEINIFLNLVSLAKTPHADFFIPNIHSLIAETLTAFSRHYEEVSWLGYLLMSTLYVSFSALLYVLINNRPIWQLLALYLLFWTGGSIFILNISLDITAALAIMGGTLLVIPSRHDQEQDLHFSQIAGTFLAIWGGLLSWDAFAVIIVILFPFVLVVLLRKPYTKTMIAVSLLAAIVGGITMADWVDYYFMGEKNYKSKSTMAQELYANIMPLAAQQESFDNAVFQQALMQVNWTMNDFKLIAKGFRVKEDLTDLQTLATFYTRLKAQQPEDVLYSTFEELETSPLAQTYVFFAVGVFGIFCFFINSRKSIIRNIFISLLLGVSWTLCFIAMHYQHKQIPLIQMALFTMFLPLVWIAFENFNRQLSLKSWQIVPLVMGLGVMGMGIYNNQKAIVEAYQVRFEQNNIPLLEKTLSQSTQIYIIMNDFAPFKTLPALEVEKILLNRNFIWFDKHNYFSASEKILHSYPTSDWGYELTHNPNIKIVVANADFETFRRRIQHYMAEHHGELIEWEDIQDAQQYTVWNVFVRKD